jgi:Mismatch repair ATPase (MutS family)
MNTELLTIYKERAERFQYAASANNRLLKFLSFFRLISFLSIFPTAYFLFAVNNFVASICVLGLIAVFLILVKKYIEVEKELEFNQNLVKINQDEINALDRNFKDFDAGHEFIDSQHDYSFDIDLYGNGSLFQAINRTATVKGKKRLSELLNRTQASSEEICQKQAAIGELAGKLDWRHNFLASKKEAEESQNKIDLILQSYSPLKKAQLIKYLIAILPPLTLFLILIEALGFDPFSLYRLAILAQLVVLGRYAKTIIKFHRQFENQGKLLSQYTSMLTQIETLPTQDKYLESLKVKLRHNEKMASTITAELGKMLNQFDYSKNFVLAIILDSVFLWDVRCISKLNDWQQKYSVKLPEWFEVIAEFDASISLANFNFNHPNWATPTVSNEPFRLNAINIGHPLIDESRCVRNNFQMNDENQITIITGANMAGKSTFLRTIGVNLVLASNGCKVFAESFDFSPTRVITNMRTSDNLMNDESYFYAELLRLQSILANLKNGEKLFVIIDEMLKGTNSIDKLNGSKELIKQLIALKTHGIVATHDLGLTELVNTNSEISNKCFEVDLNENDLSFSYKLTEGVTKTMNATFLMKKMGIIPEK